MRPCPQIKKKFKKGPPIHLGAKGLGSVSSTAKNQLSIQTNCSVTVDKPFSLLGPISPPFRLDLCVNLIVGPACVLSSGKLLETLGSGGGGALLRSPWVTVMGPAVSNPAGKGEVLVPGQRLLKDHTTAVQWANNSQGFCVQLGGANC